MTQSDSRYTEGSGRAVATARVLWRRAPLWRFFVLTAALLTFVFVLFPPLGRDTRAPIATADTATYTPPVRTPARLPDANSGVSAPPNIPQRLQSQQPTGERREFRSIAARSE